jgi:hypothetical protein
MQGRRNPLVIAAGLALCNTALLLLALTGASMLLAGR